MAFWMIKKHNVDVSFFKESIQITLKIIKVSIMRTNIFFHCIYIFYYTCISEIYRFTKIWMKIQCSGKYLICMQQVS